MKNPPGAVRRGASGAEGFDPALPAGPAGVIAFRARAVDSRVYEVTYRDRAVYLPFADAVVVADLHVGRAEASNVAFPLGEGADLRDRLAALVDAFDPAEVVFAGDVLHRFDGATVRAAEQWSDLVAVCREGGARPEIVRGNHDTALRTAWDGDVHDEYAVAEDPKTVVCHGHADPEADASLYVVGHVHPAITIESVRRPCYLYGEGVHRGADVLVLPAFTRLASGVPVNRLYGGDSGSPLVTDLDAFRPVVYDEDAGEALSFPPLGAFRRML